MRHLLRRRYGRSHSGESGFERGWHHAIRLWKDGLTLESITHRADRESQERSLEYARGMVGAVDAMSGWLDVARREAKAHGVSEPITEALIRHARAA
jgi:hypothetical protein